FFFFFQAEDGIRDYKVTGVQTCALPILIVTGLVQEARIAAGPGMIVICSSSDPRQLRALLATLDSTTFRGVISFGVAGGLDPARSEERRVGKECRAWGWSVCQRRN